MMLLAALALAAADPAGDALQASFVGWHTEIEDDLGSGDSRVTGVVTRGCVTTVSGEKGRWELDWRAIRTVALEDVFVFVEGPGVKLAVVADVRGEADLPKLRGMRDAMVALAARCQPTPPRAAAPAGVSRP